MRVDAATKRVYVGYGAGAIAAVDAATGRKIAEVAVGDHPESFQLEASGPRCSSMSPAARHISVIDRVQMMAIATWPVTAAGANYPMALDEADHKRATGRSPVDLHADGSTADRQRHGVG